MPGTLPGMAELPTLLQRALDRAAHRAGTSTPTPDVGPASYEGPLYGELVEWEPGQLLVIGEDGRLHNVGADVVSGSSALPAGGPGVLTRASSNGAASWQAAPTGGGDVTQAELDAALARIAELESATPDVTQAELDDAIAAAVAELVTQDDFLARGSSGRLLDYRVNTVGHGTAAAAYEDVAGMTSTFTVADRPVIVTLRAPVLTGNTAGARARMQLLNASAGPVTPADGVAIASGGVLDYAQATIVAANEHHPGGTCEVMFPAGAGTVSVKAQLGLFSGTGTATILCSGGGRISLKVVEG